MFKASLAVLSEKFEPSKIQPKGNKPKRRFGKKSYVLTAVLLVTLVIFAFMLSNYSAATVPLSLNYQVGEKMVYATTSTNAAQRYNQTNNIPNTSTSSINSTLIINVIEFDGSTYSVNNTYLTEIYGKLYNGTLTQQLTTTDYVNNFLIGDAARLLYNMTGSKFVESSLHDFFNAYRTNNWRNNILLLGQTK